MFPVYAHRCGTELSDEQIDSLLYSSEGWFSAIYLNLRTLAERVCSNGMNGTVGFFRSLNVDDVEAIFRASF